MQLSNTMIRVAAATTVTAVASLGAVAPALAAGDERGKPAAAEGRAHSAAQPTTAQGPKSERASKAQGPKSERASKAQGPKSERAPKAQGPKSHPAPKGQGPKPTNDHANGNASDKSANGNGHTPVTVCHRTGKAGYIVLTFDENALEAHLAHDDLYPVPDGGCPVTETPGGTTDETPGGTTDETPGGTTDETPGGTTDETPGGTTDETPGGTTDETASDTVEDASGAATTADEVLGVELTVSGATTGAVSQAAAPVAGTTAPATVAPAAGTLPNTGAGDYVWTTLAGLALVTAGGVVLTRRRAHDLG